MVFKTLPSFPKGQKCQLCLTTKVDPEALGNICQTADVIVHYFCLLLASKIQQKGTDKQGLLGFFSRDIKKEIKRGSTIVCNYCKKNGATVMCCRDNCHLNFHVPCAQQKGSLHQYFNEFKSFCDKHKPRQKIPATLKKKRDLECVLCCSPIKFNVRSHEDDPIWPTCCKPQALLHKRCLQHFATSSGYYFKCPYCSNKEEFHKGMKNFGIYIPEQEASWETEPNAYRELLERDVNCDAGRCRCPRGRAYSVRNSKWFLEVCVLCGANGRHRGCMLENIMTDTYECDVCAKVNPSSYLNSIPPEDIAEPSLLSDQGECNEAVQPSMEGNISKSLSVECEEIIEISDSESDIQHGADIPTPTVTKNVRKRRLSVRQGKLSGLKRQRLAEGGAETSSQMCFTIDDESGSSLPQVMDNPLRTEELTNNPQTSEVNVVPNRGSTNVKEKTLKISSVCTLGQKEFDDFCSVSTETNLVRNNQRPIVIVDLISDNETDQVYVVSDTDTESNASSLLNSDSSLLDLSEIPESEKSLLFDNFSQRKNYAKEFPRRPQTKRRRKKKKKQSTSQKKKSSVNTTQNVLDVSNTMDDVIFSNENINTSSDQRNLESTSSSVVAEASISLNFPVENCNLSEDESFRGFSSEEAQCNNEKVRVSTPILVEEAVQANKACSNGEKIINSTHHMSGKHTFLSNVDDINKSFTLDNLDLNNRVKNRTCQVNDQNKSTQPNFTDDNTIITNKNSVVLKDVEKDDTNHDKSVSNNYELSNCKSNTLTNVTVTSLQELSLNESSIDAVICNSNPSELSRNITNTSESKFDSDKEEVAEVLHEAVDVETNVNNVVIEECISEKGSNTTFKPKTIPVIEKTNKSGYVFEAKQPNSKKPKIICSLELKQSFSEIIDSFFKTNKDQHHKNKLCSDITSKKDVLPDCCDDLKINHRDQFSLPEISSDKVGSMILNTPINQISNVNYNTTEDSVSPGNSQLQFELHSPKSRKEVLQKACFSEPDIKLGSSMCSAHLSTMSQSSESVSDLTVLDSKGISKHQPLLKNSIRKDPLNSHSSKYLDLEPSIVISQPQFGIASSKIALEVPLNSSENISEITPVASSSRSYPTQLGLQPSVSSCDRSIKSGSTEAAYNANLESLGCIEPSQNSLLEKPSDTSTSSTMIESRKSECKLEIPMEAESSSKSEINSMSSELNSGSSNLLEDKAYLNLTKTNENKNLFHTSVGSLFQELGSCKLKPMKPESCKLEPTKPEVSESSKLEPTQSEVSGSCKMEPTESESYKLEPVKSEVSKNPSKFTPNIKTCKSSKNKAYKGKSDDHSQKKNSFQMKSKSSKTKNNKNKKEFSFVIKEMEQTKPKHEGKLSEVILPPVHKVLLTSDSPLSQEQLFSKTHEVSGGSVIHMNLNVHLKSKDSVELYSSVKTSQVHSYVGTKYPCDDLQVYPPLDEKFSECTKNVDQINKPDNLNKFITSEENKFASETENNLKGIGDSITYNDEMCSIKNLDKNMDNDEMDENNVNCASNEFEKQMSSEDSKVHSNPIEDLHQQNQLETSSITEENMLPSKIVNGSENTEDSTTLEGERANHDHKNTQNEMDGNKVNCTSKDSEPTKHDRYKICATDCSTCYNSVTLIAKYKISNDEIDVCFYCKNKINNTSYEILNSQVPNTCSCQSKNNSEVFDGSKLTKDNSLISSDSNSNCESNKSPEKQNSPFEDGSNIVCKEINTLESKSSLDLSHGGTNMATELEKNSSIHNTPSSIENSSVISENRNPETPKMKLGANVSNDKSTEVLKSRTLRQSCNEVEKSDFENRPRESRRYWDKVFKVRIILKKVSSGNKPSLMTHVETFIVDHRKYLRELLKARYFSENSKNLFIYTDVCGFRYVRLFTENIPKTIDTRVVFETGGDIVYYLQKLINHQETERIVSLQTVLIVYGNTLIPEENVFHLLELASNLDNIKLVVTTLPSQNPRIHKFNRKLMYFSKKIGYRVWDITKIHFLTDSFER